MPNTERPQLAVAVHEAAAAYHDVRESFLSRLNSEQLRLHTLSAELESDAADPEMVFRDLQYFAHRLRGAAAVFDIPAVRDSSQELELVVRAAEDRHAYRGDSLVLDAIALEMRLLVITGGKFAPRLAPGEPAPGC
jgi:hypothetical protein